VLKAREYVASGKRWVVDLDLEKFLEPCSYYTPVDDAESKRDI
jgi:hypothetical protein